MPLDPDGSWESWSLGDGGIWAYDFGDGTCRIQSRADSFEGDNFNLALATELRDWLTAWIEKQRSQR